MCHSIFDNKFLKIRLDRVYCFIGLNCVDIVASIACITTLIVGSFLAWVSCSPVWLTRTGSLIIIIGLIAAAFRLHKYFEKLIPDQSNYNEFTNELIKDETIQNIITDIKKKKGVALSRNEDEALNSELYDQIRLIAECVSRETRKKLIEKYNGRLMLYEIYLVIFGTFINGFGEYFFCIFKTCCP